ncbi:STM4014 family protein [Streptomyces sp. NPDC023723]|uniref:STM4014 family protein n=1 Tax=Streptomyces sp. NPDC023723 TaxID=3154323 RepID=UPI0033D4B58C
MFSWRLPPDRLPPDHLPRLAVVGNPENRRVTLFAAAVAEAELPAPRVVSWTEVLRAGGAQFAQDEIVRLDSPGEHPGVDRELRGVDDPTRVEGTARWYPRFLAAVRGLAGGQRLDDPDELAVLFDKRRCHAVLDAAGVPVPFSPTSATPTSATPTSATPTSATPTSATPAPATPASATPASATPASATPAPEPPAVHGWDDVRRLMRAHRMPRLFVKLAHGSSASGVLAVEASARGRVRATTSVELAPDGRLFNSLKVRRYEREADIAAVVDTLAPDGLHLEQWVPKASQGGRAADLRVVVIAGRATHAVVRTSTSPMTNLHLGGARGDLDAARAAIEAAGGSWAEALDVCERAAACFPGTLCVGVDLLPVSGWRRFVVCEVNAFGDLLPRLTGLPGSGAEGLDTYAAQVAAVRYGGPGAAPRIAAHPAGRLAPPPTRATAPRHPHGTDQHHASA